MRLLLDTHALIWWFGDLPRLGKNARAAIEDGTSQVFISAVSAIEITTKFRLGKLPEAERLSSGFRAEVATEQFTELAITVEHAALAGTMAINHKYPFDRLLIAQARIEGLILVSNEALFDGFGVERLWD